MRNDRTIPRQTRGLKPRLASLYRDRHEAQRVFDELQAAMILSTNAAGHEDRVQRVVVAAARIAFLDEDIDKLERSL